MSENDTGRKRGYHWKGFQGFKVELKELPPLVPIEEEKGFMIGGYLKIDAAELLGATAIVAYGVNSWDGVLNAQIKKATTKAKALELRVATYEGEESFSKS